MSLKGQNDYELNICTSSTEERKDFVPNTSMMSLSVYKLKAI